jgi:hypothetical protein
VQRSGQPIPETPLSVPPQKRSPAKTTLPDDFAISDAVRKWGRENGHADLEKHLENFKGVAKAKGYSYSDWDAAFQNAIRQNWAKLDKKARPSDLLERTKKQLRGDS